MDSNDLATMKALRGVKKKEIQAWIAAFEEREGRSPTDSDKEAVRPLYREFRDLEAKVAALTPAEKTSGDGDTVGASDDTELIRSREASPSVISRGKPPRKGKWFGGVETRVAARAERNDIKLKINKWIKNFEDREGRPPTSEDKVSIMGLYRELEDVERQVASPKAGESVKTSTVEEKTSVGSFMTNLTRTEAEKKRIKREIKTWLDDFEAREGRPPLPEDKEAIRPLYKRHKDLRRELARMSNEASSGGTKVAGHSFTEIDGPASPARRDNGIGNVKPEAFNKRSITTQRRLDSNAEVESFSSGEGKVRHEEEEENGSGFVPLRLEQIRQDRPMVAQEARMTRMRARFRNIKNLVEHDEDSRLASTTTAGSALEEDGEEGRTASPVEGKARASPRWAILGDALTPSRLVLSPQSRYKHAGMFAERGDDSKTTGNIPPEGSEGGELSTYLMDDGAAASWIIGQMSDLLSSDAPPRPPPAPSGLDNLVAQTSQIMAATGAPAPVYINEYHDEVQGASLVVTSVGVEEIEARERDLELERLMATREETNVFRAREANLVHREDRARQRIVEVQAASERAINEGKKAVIEFSITRERVLAQAFARARTRLEAMIRSQKGRVRELFGELRPGDTVAGRRFRVDWRGMPQPVEIRLHCIRAVRDRLPRGVYVMLSSMAERLGGRSMRWSKGWYFNGNRNDEISTDVKMSDPRPTASLPVKHGGRYFDRELRLDQNVYQLCPSKSDVRPGNVMVFELFRLAGSSGANSDSGSSRHKGGGLDEDIAVGWCVLPLADSRLRVVHGSFRVPMLRGEPNPNIDLHEGFEKLVAADLGTWLGNLYLDVRHLPREARFEDSRVEDGSPINCKGGFDGFDIEYDHVRNDLRLGRGQLTNKNSNTTPATSRWKRWRGKTRDAYRSIEDDKTVSAEQDDLNIFSTTEGKGDVEAGRGAGTQESAGRLTDRSRIKGRDGHNGSTTGVTRDARCGPAEIAEVSERVKNASGAVREGSSTADSSTRMGRDRQGLGKSNRGQDSLQTGVYGTRNKWKNGSTAPKLIGRPPPVGNWAIEDDIHAGETLDEECLSDDDALRGSDLLFAPSGEAALELGMATGIMVNESRKRESVGLRRRGEGARWDSAALDRGRGGNPQWRCGGGRTYFGDAHVWTALTNPAEMEFYRFAVAADPGTDGPPTSAQVIRQKLRYIHHEVLLDLYPGDWRHVEYWLAAMVFAGALWLRVYLHALGQWFLLYSLGVRVFSFSMSVVKINAIRVVLHAFRCGATNRCLYKPRLWESAIKFMKSSCSLKTEIAFVAWGPTFVTLCFVTLAGLAQLWSHAAYGGKGSGGGQGLFKSFSRFVAAFGVGAMLDPYLLFLVDFVAGNHDCLAKCTDYTSPTCKCHEGDAWKLYARLETDEGMGMTGTLLTFLIYAIISMTTALILYQHLLHAHMNGRLLDVWRRLNAPENEFFVPHDFEISAAELYHACVRAKRWRGVGGSLRVVIIHDLCTNGEEARGKAARGSPDLREARENETDNFNGSRKIWKRREPNDTTPGAVSHSRVGSTVHVAIYDITAEGKKSLHRQFIQTSDGMILEVFGEVERGVEWQIMASLNVLVHEEIGLSGSAGLFPKKSGVFSGMLPDPVATPTEAAAGDGGGDRRPSADYNSSIIAESNTA